MRQKTSHPPLQDLIAKLCMLCLSGKYNCHDVVAYPRAFFKIHFLFIYGNVKLSCSHRWELKQLHQGAEKPKEFSSNLFRFTHPEKMLLRMNACPEACLNKFYLFNYFGSVMTDKQVIRIPFFFLFCFVACTINKSIVKTRTFSLLASRWKKLTTIR